MPERIPLIAIVPLDKDPKRLSDLKRLSLFFDEIRFVLPGHPILRPHAVDRYINRAKDAPPPDVFRYFDDLEYSAYLSVHSLPSATVDAVHALEDAGIAKEYPPDEFYLLTSKTDYLALRAALLQGETTDPEFNLITGTDFDEYKAVPITEYHSITTDGAEERIFYIPQLPNSIRGSDFVTAMLCNAQLASGFPVLLDPILQRILEYRIRNFSKGLGEVRQKWGGFLADEFQATFGQVTYSLANGVFSSDLIESKSIAEIIRYRSAMSDHREKFVTSNLVELASLVEGNPWNVETRNEVQRYIFNKLNADLVKFNTHSTDIWEQLFGKLTVHMAEFTKAGLVGGSAGGLLGSILPLAGSWQLLLAGAALGVAKQLPSVAKDVVDAFIESRKQARSSIAYISNFR